MHHFKTTRFIDLMLNQRVPDSTSQSTVCFGNRTRADKQRAGLLATLQLSLHYTPISILQTQELCRRDFDQRLCNGGKR